MSASDERSCGHWQDRVGDWVDATLPQHEHHAMRQHLRGCADCRREVRLERELRHGIARTPVPGAPLALTDQLVQIGGSDRVVWMSGGSSVLPSRRGRRRRTAAASMGSMLLTLALVALVGWLMAPGVPHVHGIAGTAAAEARQAALARGAASAGECPEGFVCPRTLGGLVLLAVDASTDTSTGAPATQLHLYYGNGSVAAVVLEQRGRLDDPGAGLVNGWSVRAWQSGRLVLAVSAIGVPLLDAVCADLPHEPPAADDGLHRIVLGWQHLGGR